MFYRLLKFTAGAMLLDSDNAAVMGAPCDGITDTCYVDIGVIALAHPGASPLNGQTCVFDRKWPGDTVNTYTIGPTPGCETCVAKGNSDMPRLVDSINNLNNGKGFGVKGGNLQDTFFYRLNYTEVLYDGSYEGNPSGANDYEKNVIGKKLTEFYMPQLKYVVGNGADCPDSHTMRQAKYANTAQTIFITGRGPPSVITKDPDTDVVPATYANKNGYAFSIHLNSDHYTEATLMAWANYGVKKIGILTGDFGNAFFKGTSDGAAEVNTIKKLGLTIEVWKYIKKDKTPDDTNKNGYDAAAALAFINECMDKEVEALVFGTHKDVWQIIEPQIRLRYKQNKFRFKSVYGAWVAWGPVTPHDMYKTSCNGMGETCQYFLGATQYYDEFDQVNGYPDVLLGGCTAGGSACTYTMDQTGDYASTTNGLWRPDSEMKPVDIYAEISVFVQAIQKVFEFRDISASPADFLDSAANYEALRAFMRSGNVVGYTWQGPIAFNEVGTNVGRSPTTMQFHLKTGTTNVYEGQTIFPINHATGLFVFPFPMVTSPCPADTIADLPLTKSIGDQSTCMVCPANSGTNGETNVVVPNSCQCAGGYEEQMSGGVLASCKPCSVGFAAAQDPTAAPNVCTKCNPGFYAAETAMAACVGCLPGTFREASSVSSGCSICPVGRFQNLFGQPQCKFCQDPSNTSGNLANSKSIALSNMFLTTANSGSQTDSDCVCPVGYYRSGKAYPLAGECKKCPKGIDCPLGSSLTSNFGKAKHMRVQEGFWIKDITEPLKVYMCGPNEDVRVREAPGTSICIGGPAHSCEPNRVNSSIGCGECDGYLDSTGHCQSCTGADGVLGALIVLLVFLLAVPIAYYFVNSPVTAYVSTVGMVAISFGSLISLLQLTAVTSRVSINWPVSVMEIISLTGIFMLDTRFLKLSCIIGNDPVSAYVGTILFVPCAIIYFLVVGFVTRKMKSGTKWEMKLPESLNTVGVLYQVIFITYMMVCISALQCYSHPEDSNDESSVFAHPQIICWEGEHMTMFVFSIMAFVPFVLGFFSFYVVMCYRMPEVSVKQDDYSRYFRFMIWRFRAAKWYWGIPFLLRSMMVGLVMVLFGDKGNIQLVLILMVLASYLCGLCVHWPWKADSMNLVDMSLCMGMIGMIASSIAFTGELDGSTRDGAASLALFFFLSTSLGIFLFFSSLVGVHIVQNTGGRGRERKEKAAAKEAAAQKQVADELKHVITSLHPLLCDIDVEEESEPVKLFLAAVNQADRDDIRRVMQMIDFEMGLSVHRPRTSVTGNSNMKRIRTTTGETFKRVSAMNSQSLGLDNAEALRMLRSVKNEDQPTEMQQAATVAPNKKDDEPTDMEKAGAGVIRAGATANGASDPAEINLD